MVFPSFKSCVNYQASKSTPCHTPRSHDDYQGWHDFILLRSVITFAMAHSRCRFLFSSLYNIAYVPNDTENLPKRGCPEKAEHEENECGSLFWALSIPTEVCPMNPWSVENKVDFCLRIINHWDAQMLVKNVLSAL
jgi:hypothetical protein